MAQTGDIMGNHDTVLRNISLHYTKQSPYFPCSLCTGAPKFPTIFPHKHRPIRLCMRSIPCHTMALHFVSAFYSQLVFFHICTWSPCQPNPASANMPSHCAYIYTFTYIYTYTYTHTYNHIFYYSVAMLSSVCCQPNCLSHSLQSHAPQKRWVGGTRAVALLITMVYNTCN